MPPQTQQLEGNIECSSDLSNNSKREVPDTFGMSTSMSAEQNYFEGVTQFLDCRDSICSNEDLPDLLDVYRNGICNYGKDRHNSAELKIKNTYVSEQEKFYAKRWNGYQPLAPMPVGAIDESEESPNGKLKRIPISRKDSSALFMAK